MSTGQTFLILQWKTKLNLTVIPTLLTYYNFYITYNVLINIIDKIKDSMLKSTKSFEILNSPNYLRIVVGKKEGEQALKWNIIIVIISLYPSISHVFMLKKCKISLFLL